MYTSEHSTLMGVGRLTQNWMGNFGNFLYVGISYEYKNRILQHYTRVTPFLLDLHLLYTYKLG